MKYQEILRALQAGEISREEAKHALAQLESAAQPAQAAAPVQAYQPVKGEAIAIIGMSGRYPDAPTLTQYWDNLVEAKNSIREIPPSRWDVRDYYDPRPGQKGKVCCKWLGMLDDIEHFDPLFFNISPSDAEDMDPQHRIFLQEGYKAFEDAGYSSTALSNQKCGVYLGIMSNEYGMMLFENRTGETNTTGNSFAIAAARLPYFLNLKGPAIPLDTACSSSLVAAHLACQALNNHEIDMALVGGVSLYLTKESYISMSSSGMLSPDGQCKTFDNSANGFVPGEGAGALVLKRLQDAERDHDHIYGVIIGSGLNQDGKTNGITAPSVKSQIELEREVYDRFGIDPESISYVEMHGTGTKLGDPIELEALSTVFKERTDKRNYCAIGSVKTNIGHTSAAAGVASIQKVLLGMQHQQLVPTLNFRTPNEHFDFVDSPFYVNTELRTWPAGTGVPRRASVSSFGFSGTNAHLVIEEYVPRVRPAASQAAVPSLTLFVLSAKSGQQLKTYAQDMRSHLKRQAGIDLNNLSYTLQAGREEMNHRLAIVADSQQSLQERLDAFLRGESPFGVYSAQVKKGKGIVAGASGDQDTRSLLQTSLQQRDLHRLAEFWVQGWRVEWEQLYGTVLPYRIPLPTYPFAKESYWLEAAAEPGDSLPASRPATFWLHPLVQQNTSDLTRQRFASTFGGKEFFLADHVIKGQSVLPGVAYLEMAHTAAALAAGSLHEGGTAISLEQVAWVRPFVLHDSSAELHIGLFSEENRKIAFEIYSEAATADEEPILYSQGRAVLRPLGEAPFIDVHAWQAACSERLFTAEHCYEAFRTMGIEYGSAHQGIQSLQVGAGHVLAKLALPASVAQTADSFVLHPSLMDAALHASIGFMLADGPGDRQAARTPVIPFALEELEVYGACTSSMWALLRFSPGSRPGDRVQKLDVDLCDEQGQVRVRFKGFSTRALEGAADATLPASKADLGTLLLTPSWREEALLPPATAPAYEEHLVWFCEPDDSLQASLHHIESKRSGVRCLVLQEQANSIASRYQAYAVQLFEELQRLITKKTTGKVLIQLVVSSRHEQRLFSGLAALLKTAQLENSKVTGQLIEVEAGSRSEAILAALEENSRNPLHAHIRYEYGKRHVASWSEVPADTPAERIAWQDQGVYLITGGAGGLGLIFAKEAVSRAKGVTLILTGRSALSEAKRAQLRGWGANIEYRQVDVTAQQDVTDLIQSILEQHGKLNGILHSAGLTRDNFLVKKTKQEFLDVMAPKVAGLVNLDQASQDCQLDFFVFFSSMAGGIGNPGQADYAAANAFMDAYADYRNTLVADGLRVGQTLAINWPLWKEGGMHVDEQSEQMMRQSTGMIAMQTASGLEAFYQCFGSGHAQVLVMEGQVERMKQKWLALPPAPTDPAVEPPVAGVVDAEMLFEKVKAALLQMVSKLIKVKIADLDLHTELHEYGFDSIKFTEFANRLNQEYNLEFTPAIFFEHSTLHGLAKHLSSEYQAAMADKLAVTRVKETPRLTPVVAETAAYTSKSDRSRFVKTDLATSSSREPGEPEPIAIIGMSGRFPMANDLDDFWKNLEAGQDCISEIPADRWDWRAVYGDPNKEANKTNIKWGGFIDGVDEFDPLFFGISPKEAEFIDPQQRLLMTYVWKAIEDAGYSSHSIAGTNTAIFVGTASSGYSGLITKANLPIEGFSSTGVAPSVGPNRMSFLLDLHGPSEPIETACSSSLVAIHRAVSSIQNGECEAAIVGGVNTILIPDFHISFNKAGMLCEDGRCKTFSNQANGYVRGEGVGMLFLKKLKDAERDGDHIYGVIRATAENHGGRANSLTSPNPKAQAELLKRAYTKAGIDPSTVSYIEAHGTGTELGDPIEINALKSAFKDLYQAADELQATEARIGLGSVKTNIGHLELAAGIAGVIKVLLQFQHKTLVKSLHCDTINRYIQLKDSPFYIVQEKQYWEPVQAADGMELPRRAGVSSFGFGGVNAHVVLEEYVPQAQPDAASLTVQSPVLVVLSAKNEERLLEYAQQLSAFLEQNSLSDSEFVDLAYTLQVGRDAMEERLAILSDSAASLQQTLRRFLEGQEEVSDLYRGQAKRNKETLALFEDEELKEAVQKWMQRGKYAKLLDLWVKGLQVDWKDLYRGRLPRRMSAPTYPFARERYWVTKAPAASVPVWQVTESATPAALHPLVHQNASDLQGLKFRSVFTGRESFWVEREGVGRVLPEGAFLEIARAGATCVTGESAEGCRSLRLTDIRWEQALVAGEEPVQVQVEILPQGDAAMAVALYSKPLNRQDELTLYGTGAVELMAVEEVQAWDLEELQAQYGVISSAGIPGLEQLFQGAGQVLAKLSLPAEESDPHGQVLLQPRLLHAVFQAAGCLLEGEPADLVPFALDELEVAGLGTAPVWALLQHSVDSPADDAVLRLDIDLCDAEGRVCVRLSGVSFQAAFAQSNRKASLRAMQAGTLLLTPVWDAVSVEHDQRVPTTSIQPVIVGGTPATVTGLMQHLPHARTLALEPQHSIEEIARMMQELGRIDHVFWIAPQEEVVALTEEAAIAGQNLGVLSCFRFLKALLKEGYGSLPLRWTVVTTQALSIHKGDVPNPTHASLHGLIGSLAKEYPNWDVCLADVEAGREWPFAGLLDLPADPQGNAFAYRGQEWYQQRLIPLQGSLTEERSMYRVGGVYVIIGGAGGIGQAWTESMIRKYQAQVIWIGRREKNADIQAKLDRLATIGGPAPVYIAADAADLSSLQRAYEAIKAQYGQIHGVVHSAIALLDQTLTNMDEERFHAGLAAKVDISVRLAQVFQQEPLDFVLFFSSMMSFTKSAGQSNYAAGCTFKDAFAKRLAAEWSCQVRVINWGYWGSVGIVASKGYQERMHQAGIGSIEPAEAMGVLETLLAGPVDQIALMKTTKPLMLDGMLAEERINVVEEEADSSIQQLQQRVPAPLWLDDVAATSVIVSEPAKQQAPGLRLDDVQSGLIQMVSRLLQVKYEEVELDVDLHEYGLDQVLIAELADQISEYYRLELAPAQIFELATLQSLAEYMVGCSAGRMPAHEGDVRL